MNIITREQLLCDGFGEYLDTNEEYTLEEHEHISYGDIELFLILSEDCPPPKHLDFVEWVNCRLDYCPACNERLQEHKEHMRVGGMVDDDYEEEELAEEEDAKERVTGEKSQAYEPAITDDQDATRRQVMKNIRQSEKDRGGFFIPNTQRGVSTL